MFSRISGRSRFAFWPRRWMTSPRSMISFLCQVRDFNHVWRTITWFISWLRPRCTNCTTSALNKWFQCKLQLCKNQLTSTEEHVLLIIIIIIMPLHLLPLFFFSVSREPHPWGRQQMCNCSPRGRRGHSRPYCWSHPGTSRSRGSHH